MSKKVSIKKIHPIFYAVFAKCSYEMQYLSFTTKKCYFFYGKEAKCIAYMYLEDTNCIHNLYFLSNFEMLNAFFL
jgi:hypothetical protein